MKRNSRENLFNYHLNVFMKNYKLDLFIKHMNTIFVEKGIKLYIKDYFRNKRIQKQIELYDEANPMKPD